MTDRRRWHEALGPAIGRPSLPTRPCYQAARQLLTATRVASTTVSTTGGSTLNPRRKLRPRARVAWV